jgi:Electron transfer DM13.
MKTTLIYILFTLLTMSNASTTLQGGDKWVKKTYKISGQWDIQNKDGKQYVAFGDDFKTSRGPDVKVFLSQKRIEDIDKRESVDKEGLYLGLISDFSGAQSYLIPDGTDLDKYQSIVLHCEAYSVVWGGTNLR